MKTIRAEIIKREIHAWSTEYSISSEEHPAYSPAILMQFISALCDKENPVGFSFVVCKESDFDQLQGFLQKIVDRRIGFENSDDIRGKAKQFLREFVE